jgi:hypothetical protein
MSSHKIHPGVGAYHLREGPYYLDEQYEGSRVINRWERDTFPPPSLLGKPVKYPVTAAYVAVLENGLFATPCVSISTDWRGPNDIPCLFESLDHAIADLEVRVAYANSRRWWAAVAEPVIKALVFAGLIAFLWWLTGP